MVGIGLTSVCALVYLAGPLIVIGGWRPLDNYIARELTILFLTGAVASVMAIDFRRRRKQAARIAEGVAGEADRAGDDQDVLKDRMKDALATLKTASGGRSDFLYELPWYVLIGPPGSGKTTALVNSGLKFPLSRGATPAAVAGVGGTRYCDWWFTEDAVLIDTAGRYTTQDSDAKGDKLSWFAFLDLLKKNRPRQPINGVLVAISLQDLMTLPPAELAAHASAIRSRLLDLHERLKVDFPVYALFTKADLVAGFAEYFAGQSDEGRRQVWGATFQTAARTRNMVGEIPAEFDLLIERVNAELTDRLQEEPTPSNRVLLYGLPTQMSALQRPLYDFLNQIFEPTRYHASATLRGFYFTSGIQHGTPIDRLIGALARNFGAEQVGARAFSGLGKSFFLTDLVLKVIIGEAAWVSTDPAAVRRARIIKGCLYASLAMLALCASGLWVVSYARNRDLVRDTQAAAIDFNLQAGALAGETVVADHDFARVLPLVFKLRNLPAGYAERHVGTPLLSTMGLSQRERLHASAEQVYRVGLERLLRPRLMFRLEEVLEANKSDPSFIYEALKVYMMIAGVVPSDRELVTAWMRNDFAEHLYPGSANAGFRTALEEALSAMLDLEGNDAPLVEPNTALIADCQRILARLNIADRAYQLLRSQARAAIAPDWVAARHGGPDFATVFDSVAGDGADQISVAGFYTYAGFRHALVERLPTLADQLQKDNWVLGDVGQKDVIQSQFDSLPRDILDRYGRDFVTEWKGALEKLKIRPLNAGKPAYEALTAAGASTSPIRMLVESIRDESALTRERKDPGDAPRAQTVPLFGANGEPPGAYIEAQFKPFRQAVEGDAVRIVLSDLSAIDGSLQTIVLNPAQEQQATSALRNQVALFKIHAALMPGPFNRMLLDSANSFENTIANDTYREIRDEFQKYVFGPCQQLAAGRYPLDHNARPDIGLADFGRLFGGGGYFDAFFKKWLADYADTSLREWRWRPDNPVAKLMSAETLRQFQRAAEIRDAFFPTGGPLPGLTLTVTPPALMGTGLAAKLEINGIAVNSSSQPNPAPVQVQWPGGGGRTAVSLGKDPPDASAQPSELLPNPAASQWALLRLLDKAAKSPRPNGINATFLVGGRDVPFQFATGGVFNPLALPALTQFKCPATL